jgi:acetyl-CoA synthetase
MKTFDDYKTLYERSLKEPETFWAKMAEPFLWLKKWTKVLSDDIRWFEGAKTNLCLNALDRHLEKNRDRTAYIWIGNEPGEEKRISYGELHRQVCRFARLLRSLGVKKGDRVSIYLPMIPELPTAMLACARIGAIHSVVFGGFSAESLKDRILDSGCRLLITADGVGRGAKKIPLKEIADRAMELCLKKSDGEVEKCLVVRRTGDTVFMKPGRDLWLEEALKEIPENGDAEPAEEMEAEDPLFILYTSGSTGKPKGVLHTTAGYMVYVGTTFQQVFDYRPDDIYFCTADIGWITGHSYIVYGPLCSGATSILFEGVPNYPKPDRFWEIIEKEKVSIFYTAPTALRSLMREGDDWPKKHNLSSLRILGSVGEPINPEAWRWYEDKIGGGKCPIVDTWWQTETGGILITPLPGITPTKPGSASFPFFGIEPAVLKEDGSECAVNEAGYLVIKRPWPGIMRSVYGHHERFKETYFSHFPGCYDTGDNARVDEDGFYWIMGRIDDVLKISGHRIGTAEVESALVSHPLVAEAAVVGYPHEIKGQAIYAFVTLKKSSMGVSGGEQNLTLILKDQVRQEIGAIAVPEKIQFTDALPKTRSGKIMRRILRKIAEGKPDEIGDTSTLADPTVVEMLVQQKK